MPEISKQQGLVHEALTTLRHGILLHLEQTHTAQHFPTPGLPSMPWNYRRWRPLPGLRHDVSDTDLVRVPFEERRAFGEDRVLVGLR